MTIDELIEHLRDLSVVHNRGKNQVYLHKAGDNVTLPIDSMTAYHSEAHGHLVLICHPMVEEEVKSAHNDRHPESCYGIICIDEPDCGKQGLTPAEYERQMSRPDSTWRCPNCKGSAIWDDGREEDHERKAEIAEQEVDAADRDYRNQL